MPRRGRPRPREALATSVGLEVALLYKAKHLRFKDQRDFDASVPTLDATAREWLATALGQVYPGHPWRSARAGHAGQGAAPRNIAIPSETEGVMIYQ